MYRYLCFLSSRLNSLQTWGMLQACSAKGTGVSHFCFHSSNVFIWLWGVGFFIHWIASQFETIHTSGRLISSFKNFLNAFRFFLSCENEKVYKMITIWNNPVTIRTKLTVTDESRYYLKPSRMEVEPEWSTIRVVMTIKICHENFKQFVSWEVIWTAVNHGTSKILK